MTRRRLSPLRLRTTLALLALVLGARLRAEEAHAAPHAPAPAPAHAEPQPEHTPETKGSVEAAHAAPAREEAKKAASPAPGEAEPADTKPAAAPAADAEDEKLAAAARAASASTAKPTKPRAKDETHGLLNLGTSLTDRADYDAAEIAFRQVLNNPATPLVDLKSALLGLARMHRKQGALTKAVAIYERYLKDYPGDERTPDALLDLGRTLRSLGIYKTAVARFYSVINSTLKLPGEGFERYQVLAKTAQFEIAETHFVAGEYAEAAKFYSRLRLLDLAPSDRARAHFKAAYSLRLQGDREGAVTMLRSFVEQWPDDENVPEARYLLAVALRELKRPQEAFAATLELLRTEKSRVSTDPKRWAYWQRRTGNQLANDFFESGNTLNAHAIYTGLLDLSPDPSWKLPLTYQIALCYERLGILDRARTAYQTIIDGTAANPPADLVELSRMAAWRLEHLAWRDGVAKQVTAFFDTTTGKSQPAAATPPPAAGGSAPATAAPASAPAPAPTAAPATPSPGATALPPAVSAAAVNAPKTAATP